jgi:hypothetical protein
MRRIEILTAGGVTLAGLGALVGLAIGSGDGGPKLVAPRAQPVEVRTEIIRKTVNVYRREHPHHAAGTGTGSGSSSGTLARGPSGVASAVTRTRSSGAGAVAPAASATPALITRSSGGSSSSGGAGSSHAVSTRSSGGGDGEGHSGGHGD